MNDFWERAQLIRESIREDLKNLDSNNIDKAGSDMASRLISLGWNGVSIPRQWGGQGKGTLARLVAIEEAARGDAALGASLSAATLGTGLLLEFGDERQRARWLPQLARGQDIMTICMTEADSGSHLLGMGTTAVRDGDHWIINGRKWFIGNSHIATLHGVIARTSPGAHSRALSAFVVEAGTPGCSAGIEHDLAGLRGFSLGEIVFEDCRIPAGNMIGGEGEGLGYAHAVVTRHGKPNIGSVALGLATAALDRAREYSRNRVLYNAPLAGLDSVQRRLADMFAGIYSSRLALYHAAARLDAGHLHDVGFIIGKLQASETAVQCATAAVELMGARGCHPGIGAVQLLDDALMTLAPSGTSDVIRKRLAEFALGVHRPAPESAPV
ncbi:acyl-CoA dehydrogenase family protein [Nocardia sp. NPDC003345]